MVDWDQSHPDAASALWQLRPALRAGGPAEDGQKRQEPFDLTTTPGQFSNNHWHVDTNLKDFNIFPYCFKFIFFNLSHLLLGMGNLYIT